MIITPFILMAIIKTWALSDELKEFKHDVKLSFVNIKNDFKDIKTKLKIK
jgi:hypothetical protein